MDKIHFQSPEAPWENRLIGWLDQLIENISAGKIHEFAGREELALSCRQNANGIVNILKEIIKEKCKGCIHE